MSSTHLARALALSGSALALSLSMTGQSMAQQQGDVQIRPATQSVVDSLDSLEQLLLEPPEESNRINIYITPQYRHEKYEPYTEQAETFASDGSPLGFPSTVESPEFNTDTAGISVGTDYLLDGKWLFGGQLSYSKTDFDYDVAPESNFVSPQTPDVVNSDLIFGDPTDREFDEYGLSISGGYLAEPWTALLTFSYSHRDIETQTRKVGLRNVVDDSALELHNVEAEFESDSYAIDLGGSYRWRSGGVLLQPYASIGYQVEDVDGYSEELVLKRTRVVPTPDGLVLQDDFVTIDPDLGFVPGIDGNIILADSTGTVNDQTIRSAPGRIGIQFSTPLTSDTSDMGRWRLRTGLSFTHDFSDQKRTIRTVRTDTNESAAYEEENRNRNFFSFAAALGYDFTIANGSLSYQRDIGLDERKSADILSLQIRVPL